MGRPAATMSRAEVRDQLRASIDARRELGASYEDFIVEQFLDRVEGRVNQIRRTQRKNQGAGVLRLFVSLLFAMPLTAIAGGTAGWPGILIVWTVLFLLNYRR